MVPSVLKCPNGRHTGFQGRFGMSSWTREPLQHLMLTTEVSSTGTCEQLAAGGKKMHFERLCWIWSVGAFLGIWGLANQRGPDPQVVLATCAFFLNGSSTAHVKCVIRCQVFVARHGREHWGDICDQGSAVWSLSRTSSWLKNFDPLIISMYLNRNGIGIILWRM